VLSVFAHISARIVLRTPAKRQPALRRAIDGGGSAVRVPNRSLAPAGCRRERPFLNACGSGLSFRLSLRHERATGTPTPLRRPRRLRRRRNLSRQPGALGPLRLLDRLTQLHRRAFSLPVVRVDLSVQERGRVRPTAERSAIVARTSGFIASIQAHDNDLVHVGDALVVLNARELQARIDLNGSQRALLEKELADLNRLLEGASTPSGVALSELQSAKYIAEYQRFDIECRRADLRVAQAERERRRTQQLFADRAVPARDAEQASYEASAAWAEREIITRQTIAQWQADKAQKELEAEQLQAEARRLAEEFTRLKPPWTAQSLAWKAFFFEGSYVQSGQRIGEISPTGELLVEA
jgi:hypothetical protein